MNKIDKQKMLEGVLYNFRFPNVSKPESGLLDVLETIKNSIRVAGYRLQANQCGQIEVHSIADDREVARTFII